MITGKSRDTTDKASRLEKARNVLFSCEVPGWRREDCEQHALVKLISWQAFNLYIAGLAEYGNTGDDWRVASAVIFKRSTLLNVDVIETDGEG